MSNVIHAGRYDVHVGNDTFLQLGKFLGDRYLNAQKIILVDDNTHKHCLPLIQERVLALKESTVLTINAGEINKSLDACTGIWEQLTGLHANRRSLLINLGGGLVCDVGGFAASVFLRGIDFINIPTTLLSMVDSSVGGKTGINFSGLKNQVGSFTKPSAVFISPVWLRTLPERELKSGFAEMIKHALISSREKWDELNTIHALNDLDWIHYIRESVFLKSRIVNADFRERNRRKTLNFGHTIGHALESYSLQHHTDPLKHGEAIALGMIGEIFLSQQILNFPDNEASQILAYISGYFTLPVEFDKAAVIELMKSDKKNDHSQISFVLLKNTGQPLINQHASEELIFQALDFILEHAGKGALQS